MKLRDIYYWFTPSMRFTIRKMVYAPFDFWNRLNGKRHKYQPPLGDIYTGSGDFIKQGNHQVKLLKNYISIAENNTILDIGSGIGRTAIPLTSFLHSSASYEGFDVVEKGVNWCNKKIKKDFPNFNFQYIPLNNDLYNESRIKAEAFIFPYKSNRFDKAFLFSVFTHMLPIEVENYILQIARVLKPGGQCLATFFTYNMQNEFVISTQKDFNFPVKKEKYRLMHKNVRSANMAIHEDYLDAIIQKSGLKKIKLIEGYWKDHSLKNDMIDFQDILILEK